MILTLTMHPLASQDNNESIRCLSKMDKLKLKLSYFRIDFHTSWLSDKNTNHHIFGNSWDFTNLTSAIPRFLSLRVAKQKDYLMVHWSILSPIHSTKRWAQKSKIWYLLLFFPFCRWMLVDDILILPEQWHGRRTLDWTFVGLGRDLRP